VISCSVCVCMLCDTCQRVKPRNLAWFNNHRHVCTCPWEQL
jgi:hypothetical protein